MSETENEQEAGASEETWASKIESRLHALEEKAGISDDDESTDQADESTSEPASTDQTTSTTSNEESQA